MCFIKGYANVHVTTNTSNQTICVAVYVWTNIHLIVLIVLIGGVSLFQVTIKYNMDIIKYQFLLQGYTHFRGD